MASIKDERGFNQSFKKTEASVIRLQRRFDYMINQMDASKLNSSTCVLEIGCAEGEGIDYLVKKTGVKGLGIDLSKKFIDVAKEKYAHANLSFEVANFNDPASFTGEMQFGKFDYVIGNGILHHLYYNLDQSLINLRKLLKPRGKIIFIEPNIYNPYVALIFKIPFLRRKAFLEPDEMAFSKPFIEKKLKAAGFSDYSVEIRDFLLPNVPESLINPVISLGNILEKTPLTYIAQSVFITAEK
jgi:cyclopropane fatty-acyl-phospholipid synthase-like methyltransferase